MPLTEIRIEQIYNNWHAEIDLPPCVIMNSRDPLALLDDIKRLLIERGVAKVPEPIADVPLDRTQFPEIPRPVGRREIRRQQREADIAAFGGDEAAFEQRQAEIVRDRR